MKTFLEFCEKHNKFVKKIIVLIIALTFSYILGNDTVTEFLNSVFGEIMTNTIRCIPIVAMVGD